MSEEITAAAEEPKSLSEKEYGAVEDLPKSMMRRLVKDKLGDISVLREALDAFSESSRIFIHYLSAAANDICKESNRQTINAEDVFKALDDIDFSEFVGPLRASLEDFRQKNAVKRSGSSKAKAPKKSKNEIPTKDETEEGQNSNEGTEKSIKEIPMKNGTEEAHNNDEGNEDSEANAPNDIEASS